MEASNTGAIAAFMTSGHQALYGSKVMHHNYITIKIYNSYGGDTMDLNDRRDVDVTPLIQVSLSLQQFAEMITQVGKGIGTPCTINNYNGKNTPKYVLPNQKKSLLDYADAKIKEDIGKIIETEKMISDKLAKNAKLTKSDMIDIINLLSVLRSKGFVSHTKTVVNEIFEESIADAKQQLEGHYIKFMNFDNRTEARITAGTLLDNTDKNMKLNNIAEDFDMAKIVRNIKHQLLDEYKKKNKIRFDLENDEMHKEKKIKIKDIDFTCQHWAAGGDWENPVSYFVCQSSSGLCEVADNNGLFVFVPINGNANLESVDDEYKATENSDVDSEDDNESELWSELENYISKNINHDVR